MEIRCLSGIQFDPGGVIAFEQVTAHGWTHDTKTFYSQDAHQLNLPESNWIKT